MGGTSSERDVSLASGLRVADALRSRGHTVTTVDTVRGVLGEAEERAMLAGSAVHALQPEPGALARLSAETLPATVRDLGSPHDAAVVVIGLRGGQGEDGTLQALLDLTGVPYTGSGHLASALAMDKDLSKRLFREAGVRTPEWLMAPASDDDIVSALGLPVILKPSKQGSTVGLTLVNKPADPQGAVGGGGK